MSLLEARGVDVVYTRRGKQPVRAVVGASLDVERGQIVGLVGESGCGKSSLARALVGVVPLAAGSVLLDGQPVEALGHRARRPELVRLQLVFQDPSSSLSPRRRIGSQVCDGLNGLDTQGEARRARATALLEQVGLSASSADRYPHQFSGGQRQRIAIARALSASPSVVVLDEPLASLDASAQAQLANMLRTLATDLGIGMVLISHDLAIVRQIADLVYVMYLGRIVEIARTQQLWADPLHPYTTALIGAIPRPDGAGRLPETLPGEVPDPAKPPAGCPFHPRCQSAFGRCSAEVPPLLRLQERRVACWLYEASSS